MAKNLKKKIDLYILSLSFLFVMIIIMKIKIPVYFGANWQFIGWNKLISQNITGPILLSPIVLSFLFILYSIYVFFEFKYSNKGSFDLPAKIIKIKDINYENLSFIVTYIIPFSSLSFGDYKFITMITFLLVIIGIMAIKTNKFYINPTLAILGFRIYLIDYKGAQENSAEVNRIIITRCDLSLNDTIKCKQIDENISYAILAKK
jgi:hypothetical protein